MIRHLGNKARALLPQDRSFDFLEMDTARLAVQGPGAWACFSAPCMAAISCPGVFGNPGLGSGPVFGDSRLHLPLPVLAALSSVGGGGAAESQKINILTELSICHFRESFTA